jgi:ComF family protein
MSKLVVRRLEEALFPSRCLGCGDLCQEPLGAFCQVCGIGIWPTRRPWCEKCGRPLEGRVEDRRICLGCAAAPPAFHSLLAAFFYGGPLGDAIIAFKHSGHAEYGKRLGLIMVAALKSELPEVDLVVPVPLHRKRARQRGYNQAAILAKVVGLAVDTPAREVMYRVVDTGSQRGRNREERFAQLAGAFAVRRVGDVADKRILLVDDVVTTGATMQGCAVALSRAGARRICALSLALVP